MISFLQSRMKEISDSSLRLKETEKQMLQTEQTSNGPHKIKKKTTTWLHVRSTMKCIKCGNYGHFKRDKTIRN